MADAEHIREQDLPIAAANLTGVKVLMAEDNDLNAEIAEVQLEVCGMQVTRAADGKEVVDIFANHPANAFAEDVQASMDAGMNGHLSKPIVMDEVTKAIARNLNR